MGTDPNPAITGLTNVTLTGALHQADAVSLAAQYDLLQAYNDAAGRLPDITYGPIHDLAGETLVAGVYNDSTSFGIGANGILTLNGGGNPNAVWIFQAGSTLITESNSSVVLINGAQAQNVFWQVGSSATLGTYSHFEGSILALTKIALDTGATMNGRALARNAEVTLDHNTIIVPEPGSLLLFGSGLATMFSFRRRRVA